MMPSLGEDGEASTKRYVKNAHSPVADIRRCEQDLMKAVLISFFTTAKVTCDDCRVYHLVAQAEITVRWAVGRR